MRQPVPEDQRAVTLTASMPKQLAEFVRWCANQSGMGVSDFIQCRCSPVPALAPAANRAGVMTVEEAALALHVSGKTVRRLFHAGRLKGGYVGGQLRFKSETVQAFADKLSQKRRAA